MELANGGIELGHREDPFFNRTRAHFSSHQHAPSSGINSGPGMVEGRHGVYIAWQVFEEYASIGSIVLKHTVLYAINRLLGNNKTLDADLPSQGIVTLSDQESEKRYVTHLLYTSPIKRGAGIEVIEDIVPLFDVQVTLRLPRAIYGVTLEPASIPLEFSQSGGVLNFSVPKLDGHQIVALSYAPRSGLISVEAKSSEQLLVRTGLMALNP